MPVYSGGSTKDTTPGVQGTLSSGLLAGETVVVYRDGSKVGTASVSGTGWTFQDSGVGVGGHFYEARVEGSTGAGPTSNHFTFNEVSPPPPETVQITQLIDDSSGSQVMVAQGGSTYDTTPIVKGTVSVALGTGETLAVYRDGTKVGTATMNGTSWSFNDSGVAIGAHTYTAQVENTSGHGPVSNQYSFNEIASTVGYVMAQDLPGGGCADPGGELSAAASSVEG